MRFKKIYIEITNKCNFNCSFCSKDNLPKKDMSIKDFEHVLNEVKPYTNYIYLHVKGEPLFHPEFKDIILLCEKYHFKVNITTNGSLLSKQKTILKNNCIHQINVSLQSYKEDILINDILDTCDELSNNTIIVYRFWALDNLKFNDSNTKIFNKIKAHYNTDKNKLANNIFWEKAELFEWPSLNSSNYNDGFCMGTKTHIGILVDGTIIPCCLDSCGVINLGNIFDNSLKDILESKRFKDINNSFHNNQCSEELCKHCTYKNRFQK